MRFLSAVLIAIALTIFFIFSVVPIEDLLPRQDDLDTPTSHVFEKGCADGWLIATENVYIRESANKDSTALGKLIPGDMVKYSCPLEESRDGRITWVLHEMGWTASDYVLDSNRLVEFEASIINYNNIVWAHGQGDTHAARERTRVDESYYARSYNKHPGVDLGIEDDDDTLVYSGLDGIIQVIRRNRGINNKVVLRVKEEPSIYVQYLHLQDIPDTLQAGQTIDKDTVFGRLHENLGNRHLHLEVVICFEVCYSINPATMLPEFDYTEYPFSAKNRNPYYQYPLELTVHYL